MGYMALLVSGRLLTDNVSGVSSSTAVSRTYLDSFWSGCLLYTTPLDMLMTLGGRDKIPLHPLNLTAEPVNDLDSQNGVGIIKAADSTLQSSFANIGDMILSVPFLRNTHTVMAYGFETKKRKSLSSFDDHSDTNLHAIKRV